MASLVTAAAFASMGYDYLIAGGGTAGLVLANRLSENPSVSVGVLEAGYDLTDDAKVLLPLYMFDVQGNPNYDWDFHSEPQDYLDGLISRQARGKMLGGSSGINFMQFTVPSRTDLDDWEVLGNTGWNYETMAPYFDRLENFQGVPKTNLPSWIGDFINEKVHGHGGPVDVSLSPFYTNFQLAWTPTFRNLHLEPNGDPRDGVSLGGYTNPVTMTKGKSQRSFAGNAYYKPVSRRPNLHVLTGAHVSHVVFDDDREGGLTAVGLNFSVAEGMTYVVRATQEVILSGGSMKSPQMLELSGIGNSKILSSFGIDTLVNNPNVGENLQDHPLCGIPYEVNDGELTIDELYDDTQREYWTRVYEKHHTGLLTTGITQVAQLSWSQILSVGQKDRPSKMVQKYYKPDESLPEGLRLQHELTIKKILDPHEQSVQSGITPGLGKRPAPGQENRLITMGGFVDHALSRGWVHIQSDDHRVHPKFDPRYLSHPLDYEMLKDLVLFTKKVATTAPMSNHLKGKGTRHGPDLPVFDESTAWEAIKKGFSTGWHPIGTCAMMPSHLGGVVDTRLRVYGTKNLRVADASIIPLHGKGNLVSLMYAIGEIAADMIKEDMSRSRNQQYPFMGPQEQVVNPPPMGNRRTP
ncbi:MAG: hypothetical protein M1833_000602 [Piccolia ochrophora]|nr:MAG: hypothetical protein M1833_000602 [Piccolia ochrophora]